MPSGTPSRSWSAIAANYFGTLSDKLGRKTIIVFGTSLAAVIVLLYTLSNDVWYLATLQGIHGIPLSVGGVESTRKSVSTTRSV